MFRRDLNIQASRDLIRASSAPSLQAAASSHFRQGEKKVKQIDFMAFFWLTDVDWASDDSHKNQLQSAIERPRWDMPASLLDTSEAWVFAIIFAKRQVMVAQTTTHKFLIKPWGWMRNCHLNRGVSSLKPHECSVAQNFLHSCTLQDFGKEIGGWEEGWHVMNQSVLYFSRFQV